MNMKSTWLLLLFFLFYTTFCVVGFTKAADEITVVRDGKIFFKAHDSTLKEIVREFHNKYSIEIKGLESKESVKLTFLFEADSLEILLKGLLRHLGIKNYAFEFADATLKRVVVVPEATRDISSLTKPATEQLKQKEFVSVAQIQSIIESSQAESIGLFEGDIIVEYDGVPITNARQLVKEVEKKAVNNQVEMVIVREKIPMRLTLGGGFIGVRIMTKKIAQEEFDTFYLSD